VAGSERKKHREGVENVCVELHNLLSSRNVIDITKSSGVRGENVACKREMRNTHMVFFEKSEGRFSWKSYA
jgi:hypothetical protein